jgi:hypothetical protein
MRPQKKELQHGDIKIGRAWGLWIVYSREKVHRLFSAPEWSMFVGESEFLEESDGASYGATWVILK